MFQHWPFYSNDENNDTPILSKEDDYTVYSLTEGRAFVDSIFITQKDMTMNNPFAYLNSKALNDKVGVEQSVHLRRGGGGNTERATETPKTRSRSEG